MKYIVFLLVSVVCAFGSAAAVDSARNSQPSPNVLFIAIDDLRMGLGAPDALPSSTHNLDKLAGSGRLFTHHYTQVPTCGASRCALLRGRYD